MAMFILTVNNYFCSLRIELIYIFKGEFASFIWSPNETKILYVAEKKLPKSEPFYKRRAVKKDQGSGDETQTKVCILFTDQTIIETFL